MTFIRNLPRCAGAALRSAWLALAAILAVSASHAADWPSFGGGPLRQNYNPAETLLTSATVAGTTLHWHIDLGSPPATQPLFIEAVATSAGVHNEVFIATLAGTVLGINASTGAKDWSTTLPGMVVPCGRISLPGGLGTPTIDPAAGLLYIVDRPGALHALAIGSGVENAPYPVQVIAPADAAVYAHSHTSPTLSGGMLYITTSGTPQCEGQFPFRGSVIAVDPTQAQVTGRFYPMTGAAAGGGIWGPGGVVADPVTGRMFTATGNALTKPTYQPYAEAVLALDSGLNLLDANTPGPPALTAAGDFDFGSTPTMIDAPGCPPMLVALNKTGWLFLYNRTAIASGPVQSLRMGQGGGAGPFHGMLAYDPVLNILFMDNPGNSADGAFTHGALAMMLTAPACLLQTAWQSPFIGNIRAQSTTTPTIAGGLVWMPTGSGGSILAYNEVGGAVAWSSGTRLHGATNVPVTVADGQVFIASGNTLSAWGL